MESVSFGRIVDLDFKDGIVHVDTRLGERVSVTVDNCTATKLEVAVIQKRGLPPTVCDLPVWAGSEVGQSLVGALVAISLLSLAMLAFLQIYVFASRMQAKAVRDTAWASTKNSIISILQNGSACGYTVQSGNSVRVANNSVFVASGTQLAPQLTVASVSSSLIGTPFAVPSLANCKQDGNSANYSCTLVAKQQQAQIKVVAKYAQRTYSATYYVNLALDVSGSVLGCL